jgi:hypothetical protein
MKTGWWDVIIDDPAIRQGLIFWIVVGIAAALLAMRRHK